MQEITEIASRLLCEMGYERTSVRDLAEATGMTKAGLYYYFQNKEELLYVILDNYMDSLLQGVASIEKQEPDPSRRLRRFILFQVDLYCRDMHRSKLIIHDENCLSGEWLRTIKDKQRSYLVYWKRALDAYCQKKGIDLPYPSAHAMILIGMCNWIYQWYSPQGDLRPEVLAELIYQRFLHGLRAPLSPNPLGSL
ncbi:MAG: TetR/AcrR family transcriptional regulator [Deltaproteobacteria bacterium]|nr:TetR/AcrR family transcriptional regulator [Deltaproteobacteria bacterium]